MSKPTLLFLCTGNACRSQMAEGLCRHFRSEQIDCYSAGIERHGLNLLAVEAMAELGIDISQHRSERLDELSQQSFDIVVTVCGHADEHCPYLLAILSESIEALMIRQSWLLMRRITKKQCCITGGCAMKSKTI